MLADDDAVIRRRLLTRASTIGRPFLKHCADSTLLLLDFLADDSVNATMCKQELDALLWDMEQLEFEVNKTDILSFTCGRELEAYEKLHAEIDANIEQVSAEIEGLKEKFQVEKTIRAYKEEYEAIARVINELPSRQAIAADTAVEKKRLEEAKEAIRTADAKLDVRIKHFALLMNTIRNLQTTLDEDAAMDEAEQMQSAAADDDDDDDAMEEKSDPMEDEDMGN